ncbi:hypothetical protein ASE16_02685 [Leifsonia sp. Root227]|uniref:MaoC family dehydratase n=1 Tax=Leifsonia sp. Root227 TaxID=1736496 RepID=UPI0006F49FA4|nr:MaoC family dehydratase [Leifsonia sp. Root227]KRC51990.1 hypothetical protein ASE16_02685 [Leifsonia sp. Root227]
MATFADGLTLAQLPGLVGVMLGPTGPVTLTQERIDRFAKVTDDFQWIHTDPNRAATGPFGGTVAHGFLTLSLLSRLLGELIDVRDAPTALNYGLNRVRFPRPARAGSVVRATAEILDAHQDSRGLMLEARVVMTADDNPKPVCVAESVTFYPAGELT